ncbi:Pleckstrin y domain-containing F member 2 [Gaertneriomyces sp. JEL0708]|nr:Pleckstrin y domain-containing F member 2 [Gaertneriomyces sp. JEL0708]
MLATSAEGNSDSAPSKAQTTPTKAATASTASPAYDLIYEAFAGKRRDTRRPKRPIISNPVPQHDILYENQRRARERDARQAPAKTALSDGGHSTSHQQTQHSRHPRQGRRPPNAHRKPSDELIPTHFSPRFGIIGLPQTGANLSRHHVLRSRAPRTRPSLPSLKSDRPPFDIDDDNRSELSGPVYSGRIRERVSATESFESMHRMAELEYFFVGRPLEKRHRGVIREDTVYKVRQDEEGNLDMLRTTDEPKEERKLFLLSDMVVYGTPLSSESFQNHRTLQEAYARQTMLHMQDLQVEAYDPPVTPLSSSPVSSADSLSETSNVRGDECFLVSIQTTHQSLLLSFPSPQARSQWLQACRAAIATYHSTQHRLQRRRQSTASNSSLKDWGLFKLWPDMGISTLGGGKRMTVIERGIRPGDQTSPGRPVVSSVSSLESLATAWIPDSEAKVCMICSDTKFSVLTRRHHCRQCGRVICYKCSRIQDGIRLCSECHADVEERLVTGIAVPAEAGDSKNEDK